MYAYCFDKIYLHKFENSNDETKKKDVYLVDDNLKVLEELVFSEKVTELYLLEEI